MDRTAKELLKCLIQFYSRLEYTDNKWKEITKTAAKMIDTLDNKAEQLRYVSSKDLDNAAILKVQGLRHRLVFTIHGEIEDEIRQIKDFVGQVHNLSFELTTRLWRLESARNELSLTAEGAQELVDGTAHRPRLNLLLEWAIDASDYYLKLYHRINDQLMDLDFPDEDNIIKLGESFHEPAAERAKIDRILGYTQFLAHEPHPRLY